MKQKFQLTRILRHAFESHRFQGHRVAPPLGVDGVQSYLIGGARLDAVQPELGRGVIDAYIESRH